MVKIAVLYRTMVSRMRGTATLPRVSRVGKMTITSVVAGAEQQRCARATAARGTPAGGPRTAEDPIRLVDQRRAARRLLTTRLEPRGGLRAAGQEWSTLNDLPIKSAGGGGGSLRRGLERIASMALGLHA